MFFCFTNRSKYLFIVLFEHEPKISKKCPPPKTITFSHFANTGSWKNVLLQKPLLTKNWCFWACVFWNQIHWCCTKKHNLKSGKSKDKRKGFQRENKTGQQKKEKIDEENLCNWIFWCCSFHETKAKKKEKDRKRQKQGSKIKQKRKTKGRKKEKKKRETEKEKLKKGEAKKS